MKQPVSTEPKREQLERRLNELVERSRSDGYWDNATWTREVKALLVTLGTDYYVCAHGVPDAQWGEWLCDVMWLKMDEKTQLKKIRLAAECE